MKITGVETFLVEIPQKYPIAPYQSRYRASSKKDALLIRLETDNGIVGWGETPQRYFGERWSKIELSQLADKLLGRDPTTISAMVVEWQLDGGHLQSAVEMALWDILGKVCKQPLYRLLGGLYREEVELACCMGIRPVAEVREIAKLYVEKGFGTLKIKAGRDPEEDLAAARTIRDAVGDQLQLRIDPNTGYTPDVCLQLARDLEPYNLQYFEQPMSADLLEDSARIRGLTSTPLALNESVTTIEQVRKILELKAAAVLLPDTHQCGGLWACKLISDLSGSAGVPCVMHCSHDLGPKTAAMLHLVAASPNFSMANDCTYFGLDDDIIAEPFHIQQGKLKVPHGHGLGIKVDLNKVRKYQVAGP